MGYTLRTYQRQGIDAIKEAWTANENPMVVVATGGGKSVMISQLLLETVGDGRRALVVAHTEEIIEQLMKVISMFCFRVGVVMGNRRDFSSDIVIATRQSLNETRLSLLLIHGKFDYLVVDEAHHASVDNSYGQIVGVIRPLKMVGFTATPVNHGRSRSLFPNVVFRWTLFDGVGGGYLVPMTKIDFKTTINLSLDSFEEGCSNKQWVEMTIEAYEKHILPSQRLCLAFFSSVAMSRRVTRALQRKGYMAAHVDGCTPKDQRKAIIEGYRSGYVRILCNMAVLTEGFDVPETSAILLARPTKSRTLLSQILGRGLRIVEGKKDCLVVRL